MANYDVLKVDGSKSGSVELSDSVFAIEPNNSVLFEAINLQRASLRQGTHAVKNRSAVRGGGRKPWRQKVQDVRVKVQFVLHNGVVVVSYSDQHQEAMHTKCLRKCVVQHYVLHYLSKLKENNFTIVDNFGFEAPKQKNSKCINYTRTT